MAGVIPTSKTGKDMEVTIYTKSNCPFCEKAKAWFTQHGIGYTQVVLDDEGA